MKARMMVENPDQTQMTLKLTMTMKEWDSLRSQLDTAYPSWKLSKAITSMLTAARQVYYAEDLDCFDDGEDK